MEKEGAIVKKLTRKFSTSTYEVEKGVHLYKTLKNLKISFKNTKGGRKMDITNIVKTALQEMIVPELNSIKKENAEIKTSLVLINKRLDDVNSHLVDQSRRIDETNKRIDAVREELNGKIDETNNRIDAVRTELTGKIEEVRTELTGRIDETNKKIDTVREELGQRIDETNKGIEAVREGLTKKIDTVREELAQEIRDLRIELRAEIAKTNTRIDCLYEVIVRRDEHHKLEQRVANLERDVNELKRRLAA